MSASDGRAVVIFILAIRVYLFPKLRVFHALQVKLLDLFLKANIVCMRCLKVVCKIENSSAHDVCTYVTSLQESGYKSQSVRHFFLSQPRKHTVLAAHTHTQTTEGEGDRR